MKGEVEPGFGGHYEGRSGASGVGGRDPEFPRNANTLRKMGEFENWP